jgi:hypothetical protein
VKRPLPVTILAWVYIAVGAGGFVSGLTSLRSEFLLDNILVESVRLGAVVAGVFVLRGRNWACWLTLAWIASHVIMSAFHSFREFAVHCIFCAAIAWVLFRPDAVRYFRGT